MQVDLLLAEEQRPFIICKCYGLHSQYIDKAYAVASGLISML